MTFLADLPWLWCDTVPSALPTTDAVHRAVGANPDALTDAARALVAQVCVLVLPGIRPWPEAGILSPEPALLATDRAVLYPALNDLTGDCAPDRGLWVLPSSLAAGQAAALLSGSGALALSPLVPPTLVATWDCGATPETAFRAGHAAMAAPPSPTLALSASLGADRPNGVWWGIGAARALLGDAVDAAWAEETALPQAAGVLIMRRTELARMVRVRCGLPVHPLDAAAAAALRRMRAPLAPAGVWDRHVTELARLVPGTDDMPLIEGYRLARAALWGQA